MISMRRIPVEYNTSRMARSRNPMGSWMSGCNNKIFSTSSAERMFFGSTRPRRGSSSSDAGLCRMWFCRVIQRNHMRKGDEARVLRAEAQGLAVLFAIVKQVALIAFHHGPRHFDGSFACRAPGTIG